MMDVIVILILAVAVYIFFDITLPVTIALAAGLLALTALVRGDALRFIAAFILLVIAGFGSEIINRWPVDLGPAQQAHEPPPPIAEPSPPSRGAGRLALCGGVRMVRRGTCPYGWKKLWAADFSGHLPPARPAPPHPRRWRHDQCCDDCPPFRIPPPPPPPWFNPI
jgi:hypothetical protein